MVSNNPDPDHRALDDPHDSLTELLVTYHQYLVDRSVLDANSAAVEPQAMQPAELATPPQVGDPTLDSSDPMPADPALAAELSELEDCLWQLEQWRRAGVDRANHFPAATTLDGAIAAAADDRRLRVGGPFDLGARRLGRFNILRELGRGGLGVVFLAYDPVLHRKVALKVPRMEAVLNADFRKRFEREAMAAARLTHPNIVPIYEIGEAGPICYIASAYVQGQSLSRWLAERTAAVPVEQAARIVAELATAMHYAHSQGVLHRDLKPANVLLESASGAIGGTAESSAWPTGKITDFGLAKLLDLAGDETRSGVILGTPAYMSPEQAEGKHDQLGPTTDVYSLGVMFYELLTGRPPFRGASDAATLVQTMHSPIEPPRSLRAEIAVDLQAICLKCLERAPADRYPSAGELAADLDRYLRGEPTRARPLSTTQRLMRWTARNPILATLSTVSLVLLVSITTLAVVAALRIREARDEARQVAAAERAARERTDLALSAEQTARRESQASEKRAAEARSVAEQQAANATQISGVLVQLFTTADPLGLAGLGFRNADEVGMDLPLSELLKRGTRHVRRNLTDQPLTLATLLDTLGTVYCNLGQISEAEPLLREAYALRQQHAASELDLATSRLNLGGLLRWQGHFEQAEPLLRQALEARARLLGEDDLAVADASISLAWSLMHSANVRGKHLLVESDALVERAYRIRLEKLGGQHRDVAMTQTLAAMAKLNRGDEAGAQAQLLDATKILMRQEGGEKLFLAAANIMRGMMLRKKGELAAAIEVYREQMPIIRQILGSKHVLVLIMMGEFAGTLYQSGQIVEAEATMREVLRIADATLPEGTPMLIEPLGEVAGLAANRGDFGDAEQMLRKRQRIQERHGLPLIDTHCSLADVLLHAGRFAEAAAILDQNPIAFADVVESRVFCFTYAQYMAVRADYAHYAGDLERAKQLLINCRENWMKLKQSSPNLSAFYSVQLAEIMYELDPDDPGIESMLREGMPSVQTPRYPPLAEGPILLSRVLVAKGRLDEAQEILAPVLDLLRDSSLTGSYIRGYGESVRGSLLAAQGKADQAEASLTTGLAILRRSRGEHHWRTRYAAISLAHFYRMRGREAEAAALEELVKAVKLGN